MSDDELITVLGIHFNTSISPPPALSSGATRYCHSIRSSTSSAPYILYCASPFGNPDSRIKTRFRILATAALLYSTVYLFIALYEISRTVFLHAV